MKLASRKAIAAASLAAGLGVLGVAVPAAAQSDSSRDQGMHGMPGGMGPGMGMGGQGMGGMMGMMQGCRQMMGGGHDLPHLPPGNEKLELQMHADMMKAMGDILAKYAARLPGNNK